MSAQFVTPLGVYEFIGQFMLKVVYKIMLAVVKVYTVVPAPEIEGFLESGQSLSCLVESVKHAFQYTRYGTQAIRMAASHVTCYGLEAFGIICADALLLIFVVHGALICVAQRQETEHTMLRAVSLAYGVRVGIESEVHMGKHHALRLSCCT